MPTIITTIITTSRRQRGWVYIGIPLSHGPSLTRFCPVFFHLLLFVFLLSFQRMLLQYWCLVMMKLDVLVKFRKQGSKRCRLWSCLRRTSVLMVPWLWVGVKGHLNIQPMPHKPDNGYHLHHHNHRYQHHHHPQLISSSPHFHNTRHPRCKIS